MSVALLDYQKSDFAEIERNRAYPQIRQARGLPPVLREANGPEEPSPLENVRGESVERDQHYRSSYFGHIPPPLRNGIVAMYATRHHSIPFLNADREFTKTVARENRHFGSHQFGEMIALENELTRHRVITRRGSARYRHAASFQPGDGSFQSYTPPDQLPLPDYERFDPVADTLRWWKWWRGLNRPQQLPVDFERGRRDSPGPEFSRVVIR